MVPPGGCPCGGIHWQAGSLSVTPGIGVLSLWLFIPEETPTSFLPGKAMASIQGIDALLILDFQYTSFQLPVHLLGILTLGFFNSK